MPVPKFIFKVKSVAWKLLSYHEIRVAVPHAPKINDSGAYGFDFDLTLVRHANDGRDGLHSKGH